MHNVKKDIGIDNLKKDMEIDNLMKDMEIENLNLDGAFCTEYEADWTTVRTAAAQDTPVVGDSTVADWTHVRTAASAVTTSATCTTAPPCSAFSLLPSTSRASLRLEQEPEDLPACPASLAVEERPVCRDDLMRSGAVIDSHPDAVTPE